MRSAPGGPSLSPPLAMIETLQNTGTKRDALCARINRATRACALLHQLHRTHSRQRTAPAARHHHMPAHCGPARVRARAACSRGASVRGALPRAGGTRQRTPAPSVRATGGTANQHAAPSTRTPCPCPHPAPPPGGISQYQTAPHVSSMTAPDSSASAASVGTATHLGTRTASQVRPTRMVCTSDPWGTANLPAAAGASHVMPHRLTACQVRICHTRVTPRGSGAYPRSHL